MHSLADRRQFIRRSSLSLAGASLCGALAFRGAAAQAARCQIAFFEKPLQSLTAAELADVLAALGFDGVEATIRQGGRISPERAADELPAYVAALARRELRILVMATSINRADQPHAEATLRAAAKLGVKTYRLAGLKYDLKKPVRAQLDALKPQFRDLAALNRELGITAVYQNHAGSTNIGGPIWDLEHLMAEFDPKEIAVAYDIRHAMVEGSSAWSVSFKMIRPRIRAVYVKDFVFEKGRAKNVPMGEGIVGDKFYQTLKQSGYTGPVSIHSPYIRAKNRKDALAARDAVMRDLEHLRGQLG